MDASPLPGPDQLYDAAPCGLLLASADGGVLDANTTLCNWLHCRKHEIVGKVRFQDLLTMGGRVFHETHMMPLLRMQGAVREIALDVVRVDGSVLPCLLNAVEVRDDDGSPVLIRATLFEATARRRYERELLGAQRAAEESEARSRTQLMPSAIFLSVRQASKVAWVKPACLTVSKSSVFGSSTKAQLRWVSKRRSTIGKKRSAGAQRARAIAAEASGSRGNSRKMK